MKHNIAITTIVLLIVNLFAGFLFTGYRPFNIAFTSLIIVITGVLLYLLCVIKLKDAFVVALSVLFILGGIIGFILGIISPNRFQNNSVLLVSVLLLAVEVLTMIICSTISTKV